MRARPLTLPEVHALVAARNLPVLMGRFVEHLHACGDDLPTVVEALSEVEQDKLAGLLLALVEAHGVH